MALRAERGTLRPYLEEENGEDGGDRDGKRYNHDFTQFFLGKLLRFCVFLGAILAIL